MIEAISGIFLDKNRVLLLQRSAQRTWNPNKWDLMGGDVQKGEDLEEVFLRDAKQKLGVEVKEVRSRGVLAIIVGSNSINRYLFVCEGDYSNLILDHTKYSQYDWFSPRQTYRLELVPGVNDILIHIHFL